MLRIFRVLSKLLNTSDPNRNSLVRYHGLNTIFQCLNNKELENEDDGKEIVCISEIWALYGVSLNHPRADHEFKTSHGTLSQKTNGLRRQLCCVGTRV